MATCPSCSVDISARDEVCPSCGASLHPTQVTSTSAVAARSSRRRWVFKAVLVCVILVGGCTGILFPFVQQAREAAQRSSCNCMLKQIGLALHTYHDQYGSFPPAFVRGPDGRAWHSWRVLILPYLDGADLYKQYDFSEPWDGPNNIKLLKSRPTVFDCPTRRETVGAPGPLVASTGILACGSGWARSGMTTSFAAVFGDDCVFRGSNLVTIKDISDGTSTTAVIGELTAARIPWTKPEDIDIRMHPHIGDPLGFSSNSSDGGVYFLMADGTVRRVYPSAPQQSVDPLFTRNGGETVGDF
jgi:hypothetical protein